MSQPCHAVRPEVGPYLLRQTIDNAKNTYVAPCKDASFFAGLCAGGAGGAAKMKICMDYQPAVQQGAGVGRYTRALAEALGGMLAPEDSLELFYYDFKRNVATPNFGANADAGVNISAGAGADAGVNTSAGADGGVNTSAGADADGGGVRTLPRARDGVSTGGGGAAGGGGAGGGRVETRPFRLLPGRVAEAAMARFGAPAFDLLAGAADVFHFTNFIAKPLRRGHGKSVATVHDMSFARFPEFAEARNLRHLGRGIRRTAENADIILTVSEFSRREIEELMPETRGRARAALLGISEVFMPAAPAEVEAVKMRLGLERPFVLTVGTVEPRKNLPFLAAVFERLAPLGVDLVVAGAPGWKCEPIFARFAEAEARFPGRFHYLRFVPDGMLGALYSAASLFAIASFYEGFGFPPLEAMACGAPVLSSDGGSLPEVLGGGDCGGGGGGGGAARVMRGFDADEWAGAAMEIIQAPPDVRLRMSAAGQARAAEFRWRKCAGQTLAAYREACEAK